jgi:hypothetical protein
MSHPIEPLLGALRLWATGWREWLDEVKSVPVQLNSCPSGTTPIYGFAVIRRLSVMAAKVICRVSGPIVNILDCAQPENRSIISQI